MNNQLKSGNTRSGLKRFLGGTARGLPKTDARVLIKQARVALTPRSWLLKAKLTNGAVVFGTNRPGFGGRGVYVYGDAVEPEFEHLDKFLGDAGVFIDIGANTGKYAIKAAKRYNNDGVVIAVEPFVEVLATLNRSAMANGFENIRLRNFCMGEQTSAGTLWLNGNKPHDFSLNQMEDQAQRISTLTVSLDDLFRWEGLDRLDFLKLDAVGSEADVLRGGHETIAKYRPIIQLQATLTDVSVDQSDYTCFRAPRSTVKFYMPNEHDKIQVPTQLGWAVLT
ncbi:MAG TPA: FkbM family methyltransferase [Acidimicrobiales bacterium]|nr:FkbM family methyltransferase [Acidimicrobiales bacterium]